MNANNPFRAADLVMKSPATGSGDRQYDLLLHASSPPRGPGGPPKSQGVL